MSSLRIFHTPPNLFSCSPLPRFDVDGSYGTDDIAAVQSYISNSSVMTQYYTAGPSGAAVKGSVASQAEVLAAATAAAKAMGLASTDVVVSTVPLHGLSGLAAGALAPASVGAKLVLPTARTFDAVETLAAVTSQAATRLVVAPEHAVALAAALASDVAKGKKRAFDISALTGGVVVGGSAPAALGGATLKPM